MRMKNIRVNVPVASVLYQYDRYERLLRNLTAYVARHIDTLHAKKSIKDPAVVALKQTLHRMNDEIVVNAKDRRALYERLRLLELQEAEELGLTE